MSRKRIITFIAFASLAWAPLAARGIELVTNGGFETGDFTAWTVTDQAGGSGSFFIDDADGVTPFSDHLTVGPAAGSFYAVSDQRSLSMKMRQSVIEFSVARAAISGSSSVR